MKKQTRAESTPKREATLKNFLETFEQLPSQIIQGMIGQAGDESEKAIINSYGSALTEQISELCVYIRERASTLSAQTHLEVSSLMRLTAANTLATAARSTAANLQSPAAKISLSGIIEEIKKIIRMLLEIFGITLPKWLNALLNLIDEILNKLLGIGSSRIASTLSRMHQDYLGELVQLARLERENAWKYERIQDEDQ